MVKGVPPQNASDLREIVTDNLPEYTLASGAQDTWTIAMKPSREAF